MFGGGPPEPTPFKTSSIIFSMMATRKRHHIVTAGKPKATAESQIATESHRELKRAGAQFRGDEQNRIGRNRVPELSASAPHPKNEMAGVQINKTEFHCSSFGYSYVTH
jgi:hypothetical protein